MIDCLELLTDIVAVYPVPAGVLSFDAPANVFQSSVPSGAIHYVPTSSEFSKDTLGLLRGIVLDTYYKRNSTSIILEPGASLKETSKSTTAGVCYNSKLSLNTYHDIDELRSFIYNIQDALYFDLIVVDMTDNVYIIRGQHPSTSISLSVNLPIASRHDVSIEVCSVAGLSPIVF